MLLSQSLRDEVPGVPPAKHQAGSGCSWYQGQLDQGHQDCMGTMNIPAATWQCAKDATLTHTQEGKCDASFASSVGGFHKLGVPQKASTYCDPYCRHCLKRAPNFWKPPCHPCLFPNWPRQAPSRSPARHRPAIPARTRRASSVHDLKACLGLF